MKAAQPLQPEVASEPTLLELSVQQLGHLGRWPVLTATMLALLFTAVAAGLSVHLSRDYYKLAPYHYDSAAYRVQALRAYESLQARGLAAALGQSLRAKDSLDITLRLLLAPDTLLYRYGHLVVLLPFMALFFFLLFWFVFSNTRSWLLTLAAGSALFMFPLVYDVFWGLADYWKDNLATWLLSGAALTWLLSNTLTRRRWSSLSGLFLGLLVVQRSVAAVYAGILFLPLFIFAAVRRLRSDPVRSALSRLGSFALPAAIVALPILVLQWTMLHTYYLVRGYAYAQPSAVARYLLDGLFHRPAPQHSGFDGQQYGMNYSAFLVVALYAVCALAIPRRRWPTADVLVAGWLVVGFPVAVIFTHAYFHGFFALWTTLLVVCLSVFLPRALAPAAARTFALAVMLFTAATASAQFYIAVRTSRSRIMAEHFSREIVAQMVAPIAASPPPHRYAILFGGADAPLINQALFDNRLRFPSDAVALPFRDISFAPAVKNMDASQVIQTFVHALEQEPGAIAIGWCRVNDVPQWSAEPVASRVTLVLNRYLLESERWKAIQRITWASSGCLNVYQSVAQPLTEITKWSELAFTAVPAAIPVTLPAGPGVRLYDYVSRYPAEEVSGVYHQWLPSGQGLHLTVFSDQARAVVFEAHAIAGPSRRDSLRTLAASGSAGDRSMPIRGEENVSVLLHLKAGLNQIDLSVRESVDVLPKSSGDQRELMLLLVSPRLVLASKEL
jgi:hypothetical protein